MKVKLSSLKCPSCGAGIDMDIKGHDSVFCPFCRSQIIIDDGDITITKNININKKYTNDAAVEKERRKDRQNEREHKEYKWTMIGLALFIVADFAFLHFLGVKEEWDEKKNREAGMIQAGQSSSDLEGKNYSAVVEQLKAAGFSDIKTIDLDDNGWFTNKEDTVESVSIDGDTSFSSSDFFDPEAKIIITYH